MYTLLPAFRFMAFFAFLVIGITAYSQPLSDEINAKISESDQKKLNKADQLQNKGELTLSDAGYIGDQAIINSIQSDSKDIKKQLVKRAEAAGYYKEANATRYDIYTKYINNFWKNFSGNKSALDVIKQRETSAVDSFKFAQTIRKESDKKSRFPERLPLLIKAEYIENNALLDLQKVLVSYFYYPAQYNSEWFTEKKASKELTFVKDTVQQTETTEKTIEPAIQPVNTASEITVKSSDKKDTSLYTAIDINENQVDMFNKFLQKTYPDDYEKYIIDFHNIDYSNIEQLKESWYNYRYGIPQETTTLYAATDQKHDSLSNEQVIAQNISVSNTDQQNTAQQTKQTDQTKQVRNVNVNSENATGNKNVTGTTLTQSSDKGKTSDNVVSSTRQTEVNETSVGTSGTETTNVVSANEWKQKRTKELQKTGEKTSEEIVPVEEASNINEEIATGFLYKVQIAACRVALDPQIIKNLYPGPLEVTESFEDNWYKYTIGSYDTYRDARNEREAIKIPAFVVAYLNGKRINITTADLYGKQNTDYIIPANIKPEKIAYKIQIAASKSVLSKASLKKIYNGTLPVESLTIEGWYKYFLYAGNTLKSARDLVDSLNNPDAFICAFYENEKISLITAIRLTKNN